jgi:hypothetical protein
MKIYLSGLGKHEEAVLTIDIPRRLVSFAYKKGLEIIEQENERYKKQDEKE